MSLPKPVVDAFPPLENASISPLGHGLINQTWLVESGSGRWVLQQVNPIFDPRIHSNIQAVSLHLRAKGRACAELLPTRDGRLYVEVDGRAWRLMTCMPGQAFDTVQDAAHAFAAGHLVGKFHAAVQDIEHVFVGCRQGVHDTKKHMATLSEAVTQHVEHRLYSDVVALAADIAFAYSELPQLGADPTVVGHGDLKINNLLFDVPSAGRYVGSSLIDLDTLGPMQLGHELGDMWRSWCNASGEDSETPHFDLGIFEASLAGYCDGRAWSSVAAQRDALLYGVEIICVELAARFAADALRESYFGYDQERFAAAGEHNLVRAQGQYRLAQAAKASREERARMLDRW